MRRKLLCFVCLIVWLAAFQPVFAQDPTAVPPSPPIHPALQALNWGIDFFPFPQWVVGLAADTTKVVVEWSAVEPLAIVTYEQRFFSEPEINTGASISEFVNSQWLGVVMDSYDNWEEVKRCYNDTHVIVDMKAPAQGETFAVRYWIWGEPNAIVSVTAAYRITDSVQLDALGAALIPTLPRCE